MYARGSRAISVCDQCGTQWLLKQLRYQVIAGITTKLKHCPDCLDKDNPQLQIGKVKAFDPFALHEPRPDPSLAISRSGYGFTPFVGGMGCTITCHPQVFSPHDVAFNFVYINY